MPNITDLVLAVKDKKEKDFELFDKIRYICRNSGEKFNEGKLITYVYAIEDGNLKLFLHEGELSNRNIFQDVSVQDSKNAVFFNYFNKVDLNHPFENESKGKVDIYVSGEWEKLVDSHYSMSLFN